MYEAQRIASERQHFLAEAGEFLASSLDPETALDQLASLAVRHIADWCGVEMVDEHGDLHSVVVAHADEEKVELARQLRERYPVDPRSETGVPNVIRTGTTEVYPEVTDEMLAAAAQDEGHLRNLRELGLRSAMIVPLRARGRVLGAITFVASSPDRRYGDEDVELAEDLARRAALAVDNAMLFRREHEAAVILQRSLLPDSVPAHHDGIEFDVRYRPAGPGVAVGGDWYDIVLLDGGAVGLTIGDVAGRGLIAASIMGRIRPALRAYVLDGHGPAEALERLDRLMKESETPNMATLFHLHYDPKSGFASYVRAGHPPALLRRPTARSRNSVGPAHRRWASSTTSSTRSTRRRFRPEASSHVHGRPHRAPRDQPWRRARPAETVLGGLRRGQRMPRLARSEPRPGGCSRRHRDARDGDPGGLISTLPKSDQWPSSQDRAQRRYRASGGVKHDLLVDNGHSQVDFTVVGSGPNGANPHHEAGDRTIEDGDMIVLDFGGLKDGYGSDTLRTYPRRRAERRGA